MCSLWQHLSDGTIDFEHVTLTVTFDLHLENFVCHTFGLLITFLPSEVRHVLLLYLLLLCHHTLWIPYKKVTAGATGIPRNAPLYLKFVSSFISYSSLLHVPNHADDDKHARRKRAMQSNSDGNQHWGHKNVWFHYFVLLCHFISSSLWQYISHQATPLKWIYASIKWQCYFTKYIVFQAIIYTFDVDACNLSVQWYIKHYHIFGFFLISKIESSWADIRPYRPAFISARGIL